MRAYRAPEWLDAGAVALPGPADDRGVLLRTAAGELRVHEHGFDGLRLFDSHMEAVAPMEVHPRAADEAPVQCMQVALAGGTELRLADGRSTSTTIGNGSMFRIQGDAVRYRCGPGRLHLVGVSADMPLLAHWFGAKIPAPLRPLLHDCMRPGQMATLPVPAVEAAARALTRVPCHGPLRAMMLEGIALQMVAGFLDGICGSDAREPALSAGEHRAASEAYERLFHDLRAPPTATELARSVGLSPRRLERAFHAIHGGSVFGVLRRERLAHAFVALRTSHLPVKTIAWHIGYDHVASFTHAFQAQYGVAPSAVRGRRRTGAG